MIGRDINLEILRVEGYRKFCNKIFNATKFAMLKLDEKFVPEPSAKVGFRTSHLRCRTTDAFSRPLVTRASLRSGFCISSTSPRVRSTSSSRTATS